MTLNSITIDSVMKKLSPVNAGTYTIESIESLFNLTLNNPTNSDKIFLSLNPSNQISVFVKGVRSGFQGIPISQEFRWGEWTEVSGAKFEALMITDVPTHLKHLLSSLISNLADALESSSTVLGSVEFTRIINDSLASEFDANGLISNSLRIGLFGELILLKYLLEASQPVDYINVLNLWTGPGMSRRDFITTDGFVEVKATGKSDRIHQINDFTQLCLKATEKKGYLFSVKAKSDDSGNKHLVELINEIRAKFPSGYKRLFDDKLENYGGIGKGYFRALEPAYNRMKKYLYDSKDDAFFELTDDYRFPVNPPLNLPRYVELSHYDLNLNQAPKAKFKDVIQWILT